MSFAGIDYFTLGVIVWFGSLLLASIVGAIHSKFPSAQGPEELEDGPMCEGCGYELDERVDVQFEGGFCNDCI
jgi:hypothetical protein